jgi:hypothetical protein
VSWERKVAKIRQLVSSYCSNISLKILSIQKTCFFPTWFIIYSERLSQLISTLSLHNINQLMFFMEAEFVLCEVRNILLSTI